MKKLMYRMILVYIGCLLTALVAMCGCKTSAPELTQSDQSETLTKQEQMEMYAALQDRVNASIQKVSSSWSEQLWNLNAQWNRTVYSPPDSTGKQYIQSEERMDSQGTGKNQQKDTVFVDFKYDAIRQEFLKVNTQIDELRSLMKHIAAEKKTKITWFQAALQFLGVCAIIYTIYRVFIRKSP
jgi:hypothetical protein